MALPSALLPAPLLVLRAPEPVAPRLALLSVLLPVLSLARPLVLPALLLGLLLARGPQNRRRRCLCCRWHCG